VITSIVYQPLMENSYTLEEIKGLEGNKFCLNNAPDLLIITIVNPEVVIERLKTRKKEDDAIFEQLEFQKKVKSIYESSWLKQLFEEKGSKVVFLDTNPPKTVEDTKNKAIKILKESVNSS
jgi:thymidylate kinase